MGEHVSVEARGEVALVRIDRPPANALDLELLDEGRAVLERLRREQPGAVVVIGREGFFSAGVDLKLAPELDRAGQEAMVDGINRLFAGWYALSRPVVAAVNGHAIAGGLILALCADHRVGGQAGKLGLTELRVGIPYPAAAMAIVKAELAPPAARRLALRAELLAPAQALELGLVDELVPDADVLPRALEVAEQLAALPAATYGTVKGQLRGPVLAQLEAVLSGRADPMLEGWLTPDTQTAAGRALGSPAARSKEAM